MSRTPGHTQLRFAAVFLAALVAFVTFWSPAASAHPAAQHGAYDIAADTDQGRADLPADLCCHKDGTCAPTLAIVAQALAAQHGTASVLLHAQADLNQPSRPGSTDPPPPRA